MIGMTLLAMERTANAIQHFRTARDADPKGKYGDLAVQQLKQHSVWGQRAGIQLHGLPVPAVHTHKQALI